MLPFVLPAKPLQWWLRSCGGCSTRGCHTPDISVGLRLRYRLWRNSILLAGIPPFPQDLYRSLRPTDISGVWQPRVLQRDLRTSPPAVYLVYGNGGLDAPGALHPAYAILVDDMETGHDVEFMARVRWSFNASSAEQSLFAAHF